MIWTAAWAFATGLPVGALAGWVLLGPPHSSERLLYCALAAGVLWALLVSGVALAREGDAKRGPHVAVAGSSALAGLPGLLVALAQLAVPWLLLLAVWSVMTIGLLYGARTRARPGGWLRQVLFALGFLSIGVGLAFGIAAAAAGSRAVEPALDAQRAASVYDVDARVVNQPLPVCGPDPSQLEVLLERGARPRLSRDGAFVWFDAEVDGARQVHRLELETREVRCWTCAEEGNNLRPAPGRPTDAVIFETDRHASAWEPFNTELHAVEAAGWPPPPSRRLTRNAGPDDHAIVGAEPRRIAWSRLTDGRYAVASAQIRRRPDGFTLGSVEILEAGGSAWLAPAAWSPNARALVVVAGNPFRPLAAHSIDFATGTVAEMAGGLASAGAVAFNADGGWMVTARESARAARRPFGWLPPAAGFGLAAAALGAERAGPLLRTADPTLRLSSFGSLGEDVSLGSEGRWGAVTGLTATGDGKVIILGQQRACDGLEERLLRIALDCRT